MSHMPRKKKSVADEPEKSLYDEVENQVQTSICPHFQIFHEGLSKAGNAWGKFYCKCTDCTVPCTMWKYRRQRNE